MEMPLVISQPMRRSLVQLRQSQVGLRPWVSHTGVPAQDRVLWGRTLPGKDMLSGLGRGQPAIKVPLPSARTFLSHVGSRCWVSRWLSGESSPKAASRSRFCPPGLPQRRDVRNSIPLELPAELPLLLLPPSVVLSQKHEDVPPRLMWLQPTEHLDGSWGKVSATTGNRHPRAASCLSPRPTLRSHSPTMSRIHPPGPRLESLCHFLCREGGSSLPPPCSSPLSWGLGWTVGSPSTSSAKYLPRRGHSQQTRGATSQRTPGKVGARRLGTRS